MVSLRIFGMESHYTITILVSLSTVHKEIYKKCPDTDQPEISFRGQFKLEPYPHWSPLKVLFEFSDEHPRHFYMGVPQGVLINSHINFVFLHFLKGPVPITGTFLASLARPWRPEGVHLRELPLHKLYYY